MNRLDQFQRLGLLGFLVLTGIFFAVTSPYFISMENITNIFIQSAVLIILGAGMTLVIGSAGIDLSIGAILALSSIIVAGSMKGGLGVVPGIFSGIISGFLMGAINGVGIAHLRISPFIVTLGTTGIYRALALIFTDAMPIYGLPYDFRMIGAGWVGPIPISVIVAAVILALFFFLIVWTKFGANARAVGDNAECAFRMGIPVGKTLVMIYALSGASAALAGIVMTARLNTAEAIAGMGIELETIAAVIMGGTSFFGGEARIGGTLLGALIIGTLANGLTLVNVPSYYQQLVIGLVFIMAVLADQFRRRGMSNFTF
ncbi:putative D-allose transport system permease protein AlsC [delta proteobacterium NaphS2]|nr:putative D-allose transport system permease protein AlsC [delta proteobacterium NaphS2]